MEKNTEILDKIRKQFDFEPYPNTPLETSPKDDIQRLYTHDIVTAYYIRNKKVITPEGKLILDAGCGSGYKSLALAHANPGAKIVGIDLSEKSVELARLRLQYHGFDNVEFFAISIDDLPSLNLEFDYINCDEVLYLMPDIEEALEIMASVLKPDGIIRSNLHSALQRTSYYRAQQLFNMMGLMDDNPEDMEIDIVQEIFKSLKQETIMKSMVRIDVENPESKTDVLMNYLLQGDRGYTVPELFAALSQANLEFISMVNFWQWDVRSLFQEPDNLPVFLSLALPEASREEQLRMFELIHPVNRLLDFWCGHRDEGQSVIPVTEWSDADWQKATIHLHPQMKTDRVKEELQQCFQQLRPFPISKFLPIPGRPESFLETTVAACLMLPLLESPQSMASLVEQWLRLQPVDLETRTPNQPEIVFKRLQNVLTGLENFGYILLELPSEK
ncbi:MAG: class I SAM-dependent methyltransferase [Spirulinaceae cyanobacterium]